MKNQLLFRAIILCLTTLFTSCGLDPSFKTIRFERPVDILGCSMNVADNYNANATMDDGSCLFTQCFDSTQDNFDDSKKELIEQYLRDHGVDSSVAIKSNCSGRSACLHNLSKNKDPIGTKENGSCLFKACMDQNFHEYIEYDYSEINKYIIEWGETYNGLPRIESSCDKKRQHCKHSEAFNYTGPTDTRGDPYCIFYACTKPKFEGHAKYLEYKDFLSTHPGEVIEDNSASRCGAKLVSKNIKELDVNKENIKSPVDVVFIIDDSRSMDDEVARVKDGLIEIAPTLQGFNADIKLELHKIDNVNKRTKTTTITNTSTSKINRTEYLRPVPVHTVDINPLSDLTYIEDNITKGINLVTQTYGDGNERGACYIQRILEDFKTSARKNLITILISDEDDHEKGSSKNCYRYTDRDLLKLPPDDVEHFPFKDSSGKDDLINTITEGVIQLSQDKIYALASIHWNKAISKCTNNQGYHAENYIKLINQLKSNSKIALEGDICEKDYEQLLNRTLADTIREIIGFKYFVSTLDKNPVVEKVELVTAQGIIELTNNDYTLEDDGTNYYLKINESFRDILKNSTKVRITVIEDL